MKENRHLLLFCCLALLVLAPVGFINASIIVTYRGDEPNVFDFSSGIHGVNPFDINGNGTPDFFFPNNGIFASFLSDGDNRFVGRLGQTFEVDNMTWTTSPLVIPLPEGTEIGPDASFPLDGEWHHHKDSAGPDSTGFNLGYASSGLMQLSNAYIGVEFTIDDNVHYGWIHYVGFGVAHEYGLPGFPAIPGGWVNSWAYNSIPGEPIHAGQIPEPRTYALLAGLAALGLAALRLRRRYTSQTNCPDRG